MLRAFTTTTARHMRIISFNANGIRSAATKGFFDWFGAQRADVLCLQETKAQVDQLDAACIRARRLPPVFP
jgi:exodeoxyribonuclease-3